MSMFKEKKVIHKDQVKQVVKREVPTTEGLHKVNINEMNSVIKQKKKNDEDSLISRYSVRNINEITQQQDYKEVLVRMNDYDRAKIKELLTNSVDLFDFYQKAINEGYHGDLLVAIGLITKSENSLFKYLDDNQMEGLIRQGSIELYDQAYIQQLKEQYQEFAKENPELISSIQDGKKRYQEDKIKKMPTLYILGNEQDYHLVDAMSLPTKIRPLINEDDLDILEKDIDKKCVIMFKDANPELGIRFHKIQVSQGFPLLLSFHRNNYDQYNEIVPFNRKSIMQHFVC